MRFYILTEREREALKCFIETRKGDNFIWVLLNRIKRSLPRLEEDLKLIKQAIE